MARTRIKLAVFVDLDEVPGTFHSAESAQNVVRNILTGAISHYNPTVSIEAYDTSKVAEPEEVTLELVIDKLDILISQMSDDALNSQTTKLEGI